MPDSTPTPRLSVAPLRKRCNTVLPSRQYRCTRCEIRIPEISGLCEDCRSGAPLITYALAMGSERYFQTRRPAPALYPDGRGGNVRRAMKRGPYRRK